MNKVILPEVWRTNSGSVWNIGNRTKKIIMPSYCLQDWKIVSRIGSHSMNGMVYHIVNLSTHLAAKILLINKYSIDKNEDEIKISKLASKLVLEKLKKASL